LLLSNLKVAVKRIEQTGVCKDVLKQEAETSLRLVHKNLVETLAVGEMKDDKKEVCLMCLMILTTDLLK
jgi:hypothetical protein